MMNYLIKNLAVILTIIVFLSCCSQRKNAQMNHEEKEHSEFKGEHSRDAHSVSEGEESGTEYSLTDKYDQIRNGARLILVYNKEMNAFNGTVQNIENKLLERVRVEVHLSNGKELGPTKPVNLKPGEKINVKLKAESVNFSKWSAHPEVGNNEHGHENGEHSHGSEKKGEHQGKGENKHN